MDLTALVLITSVIFGVQCTLRFAPSYSDHMVLQRAPQRALLWGYADTDHVVTAFMNGVQVGESAVMNDTNNADVYGIWKVKLPPETHPGPHTILVKSNEGEITLSDVLFGDVWLCAGQSNMQFEMYKVYNSTEEIKNSLQYRDIRMISNKRVTSSIPQEDAQIRHPWTYPVKGIIENFSSLCFMFARDLQKHLGYPIGLIESSWGGTPIEVWSSPSAMASCPVKLKHRRWQKASVLWNSMIYPYTSMTIKGAIWYQGEGNFNNAKAYQCLFPAMIEDWRNQFYTRSDGQTSEKFPFGFVQLAPYRPGNFVGGFPRIRRAQTSKIGYVPNSKLPNTFMAVAVDLPDFTSPYGTIHPRNKQDIAARLVLGARNLVYGDTDVVFQGPFPTAYRINLKQQTMAITFHKNSTGVRVHTTDGFEICCATTRSACRKHYSWTPVEIIRYRESTVEINILGCNIKEIAGVRYLWKESPCPLKKCAIYGIDSQLPAPPFRKVFKKAVPVLKL